jgi:hypothetical protein
VGDFNRDGHLDLAAPQLSPSDISVLLGKGDGTFQAPIRFAVGLGPVAFVTADFSNDGRRDVAGVNPTTNAVSVALGAGDGTLQAPVSYPVGNTPVAVVAGDFNGDGRLDLAIANFASNDVSVLLGLGDGTFGPEQRYAVGKNPTGIVAGDFNGDGHLDLAVSNSGSNDISVLFGQFGGTFANQVRFAAPGLPQALVAGDFNGDGILDLATADYRSQDVAVFLGRGDGTFEAPVQYGLGTAPISLITGDFNGDGVLDLATANFRSNDVSVLLGRGNGTFQPAVRYEAGSNPLAVVAGDFNRDGRLDLAAADSTAGAVALLFGRGDGTFGPPVQRPVPAYPGALVADDFNNDGRTDLAVATQFSRDVSTLMGLGNGTFLSPDTISNEIHATPLVADFNGDGMLDVAVLNNAGQILLRYGRPDAPGTFEPPVVVNPDPAPPARDLALVRTGSGVELAALDAGDSGLSFYSRGADGTFTRTARPLVPGVLPVRLAAGDLNGDGRDDLVVAATGTNRVFVYLQNAEGGFGATPDYQVGVGVNPSAIRLADVDGDGRLDIVVTNQFSGDVSVLLNDPTKPFCSELRFRAGLGLYWMDQRDGSPVIHSFQGSAGVVSGIFDEGKSTDLVVTNSGANSFSLLQNTGLGGLLNPQAAQTFATGVRPTGVVAGDFNRDGHLDLAVLNEGSQDISIFLGNGHGGFTEKTVTGPDGRPLRPSAGNAPTGLALADVNGDGIPDLLVGNQFGDVLVLLGNGDGTFEPYQPSKRSNRHVALAIADLTADGKPAFIFADAGLDRVTVQYPQPGQTFEKDRSNGLLAPGAVAVADLNGDGILDLVVANSGANNILVYPGLPGGGFGPEVNGGKGFFAGTNPASITIKDLNGDGIPDLVVANEGSNDVSILLGQGSGSDWTLVPGPRLKAGAGPVSTTVADVMGNGIPDILVANSQSNNVFLLPGVGGGFFNDQHPEIFATGIDPRQALVGDFTGTGQLDLVTVNAGSNDLTFFPGFGPGRSIGSGGETPVMAVAADFNGDGITDLLVANNGDGRIALLAGGPDGPSLTQTFSQAGVPHPSALALDPKDARNVYGVEDGQASAVLLTSFGVVVPAASDHRQAPPLADISVVNGPGFAAALDILSMPGEAEDALGGVAQARSASVLPAIESALAFLLTPLSTGIAQEQASLTERSAEVDPGLTDFMMGLDDAFRQLREEGPPTGGERAPAPARPMPEAVDPTAADGEAATALFAKHISSIELFRWDHFPEGEPAPMEELSPALAFSEQLAARDGGAPDVLVTALAVAGSAVVGPALICGPSVEGNRKDWPGRARFPLLPRPNP